MHAALLFNTAARHFTLLHHIAAMVFVQLAAAAVLYTLYRLTTRCLAEREFQRFALENGCREPPHADTSWLFCYARLRRLLKLRTSGEDLIDDIVAEDFIGVDTLRGKTFSGQRVVATIEPANIQSVLATHFKDYETGERRHQAVAPVLGRSIFSSDGAAWERSRALFRPFFSRQNINNLATTDEAAKLLVDAVEMSPIDDSGWSRGTDMLPLLYNLTLDTATDLLFGESVESQASFMKGKNDGAVLRQATADRPSSSWFGEEFALMGLRVQQRMQFHWLCWLPESARFRQAISNVHAFAETFVKRAVDSSHAHDPTRKDDLLATLVAQTEDRTDLRNQTLALLFAGRDTTAALLSWCIVRLALHPDALATLRKAILRDFGEDGDEPLAFNQLKACRDLQHFINEVLRLNTIVPINARVSVRHTVMPIGGGADRKSPVAVRKGTNVFYSVYLMHRREDLWGKDALDFRPSRWTEKLVHNWQFLPFNGGPRLCLGQQFALTVGLESR